MIGALRVSHLALAGAILAAPSVAQAQSAIAARVDVGANAGYATNPFLARSGETGSGFVEGYVQPNLAWIDELGRIDLSGTYRRTQYFRRYSDSNSYGLGLNATRRLSEKLQARGRVNFDSGIVGADDIFGGGGIVDPDIPESPDIDLIGQRQRRNQLTATTGVTYTPNAREAWTADVDASKVVYPDEQLITQDYRTIGGRLGYTRQLSEQHTVGVTLAYTDVNYERAFSDSEILTPQVTYRGRYSGGITVNAALGVSFSTRDTALGSSKSTDLSGSLEVCRENERSTACLRGSRSTSATGFGGVRTATNIGASYSYRLSERGTISADASYSRNSGGDFNTIDGSEYVQGSVTYRHRLSDRLNATASAGYRDIYQNVGSTRADINGRIGVSYTLGDRR